MIVIANVFPKLQTARDLVRPLSSEHCFRTPFDSQRVKGFETLVKCWWEHFQHIFSLPWSKTILKMSVLVICETLGLFVNSLTANEKNIYIKKYLWYCENLLLPIQVQLSRKPESCPWFLVQVLEFKLHLKWWLS